MSKIPVEVLLQTVESKLKEAAIRMKEAQAILTHASRAISTGSEDTTDNREVPGSNPGLGTINVIPECEE